VNEAVGREMRERIIKLKALKKQIIKQPNRTSSN